MKTNLGVARRTDSNVIDLTDDAMTRQVRAQVNRKIEDKRIVNELKAMIRKQVSVDIILDTLQARVMASPYT